MSVPVDGAERLAHFIKQRLSDLGMTQEELAARGGPDRSTLGKLRLRAGQNTAKVSTLLSWDDMLAWERGSCAVTLLGDSPREVGTVTTGGTLPGDEKKVRLIQQANRRNDKLLDLLATMTAEAEHVRRQLRAALGQPN